MNTYINVICLHDDQYLTTDICLHDNCHNNNGIQTMILTIINNDFVNYDSLCVRTLRNT